MAYLNILRVPYADVFSDEFLLLASSLACCIFFGVEVFQAIVATQVRRLPIESHIELASGRVGVVVAAHNAFESLLTALPTVINAFPPEDVWVADNGKVGCLRTKALCESLYMNYVFYDRPNKTNAIVQTVSKLQEMGYKYVLLLDDDTQLADGFSIRYDLLNQTLVAGYCVAITIQKNMDKYNIWEHLVDMEYRSISYRNANRAYLAGTIPFIHGICCVYNIDRMLPIYKKLCTLEGGLPFGEDAFAGIDFRLAGYRLLQDNTNVVATFCPTRLFPPPSCTNERTQGFGASSLWKQRALRWYLSWPRRLLSEIAVMLTYQAPSHLVSVLYRVDAIWQLAVTVTSSTWPLTMVHVWLSNGSYKVLGFLHVMFLGSSVLGATIRYISFPPLLRPGVHWTTIFLNPVMNITVTFLMGFSFLLSLIWYVPWHSVNYNLCYS
jgi:hypothetical protein